MSTQGSAQGGLGPRIEVTYLDRVRVVCGMLHIGNAEQMMEGREDAVRSAVLAIKSRAVFK